jgi:hypothetical protein
MKGKGQQQIQSGKFCSAEQVQAEINSFFQAVDSYPARAAMEPSLSFQQYLVTFFVAADGDRRRF